LADVSARVEIVVDPKPTRQGSEQVKREFDALFKSGRKAAKGVKGSFNELKSGIGSTAGSVSAFRRQISGSFAQLKKEAFSLRGAFLGVGAALVLRSAVNTLKDFERQMGAVGAISGTFGEELDALRQKALALGATSVFTGGQVAVGLRQLALSGQDVNKILASAQGTVDLAQIGMLDLGRAAKITVNALDSFLLPASEAGRVTDILTKGAISATTTVGELGESFAFVGATANTLGIKLGTTIAVLATLRKAGLPASTAGSALRVVLSKLLRVTGPAAEALDKLGLSLKDVSPVTHDLVEIFDILAEAGLGAEEAVALFEQRGATAANAIISLLPFLKQLNEEMKDVEGISRKVADAMVDNLAGAFDRLKAASEAFIVTTGDAGVTGVLRALLETTTGVIRVLVGQRDPLVDNAVLYEALAVAVQLTTAALVGLALGKTVTFLFLIAKAALVATGAVRGLTLGMAGLNLVTKLSPLGVFLGLLGLVSGALFVYNNRVDATTASTVVWSRQQSELSSKIQATQDSLKRLAREARLSAFVGVERTREEIKLAKEEIVGLTGTIGDFTTVVDQLRQQAKETIQITTQVPGDPFAQFEQTVPSEQAFTAEREAIRLQTRLEQLELSREEVAKRLIILNNRLAQQLKPRGDEGGVAGVIQDLQKALDDVELSLAEGVDKVTLQFQRQRDEIKRTAAAFSDSQKVIETTAAIMDGLRQLEEKELAKLAAKELKLKEDAAAKEVDRVRRLSDVLLDSERDTQQLRVDINGTAIDQIREQEEQRLEDAIGRARELGAAEGQLAQLRQDAEERVNLQITEQKRQVDQLLKDSETQLAITRAEAVGSGIEAIRAQEEQRVQDTIEFAMRMGATEEELQKLRTALDAETNEKIKAARRDLTFLMADIERELQITRAQAIGDFGETVRLQEEQRVQDTIEFAMRMGATEKELQDLRVGLNEAASTRIKEAQNDQLTTFRDAAQEVTDLVGTTLDSMIRGTDGLTDSFDNLLKGLERMVVQILIIEPIMQSISDAFKNLGQGGSAGGGFLELLGSIAGSIFGGAKGGNTIGVPTAPGPTPPFSPSTEGIRFAATGGTFRSGEQLVVGERGPELFIPKARGTVVPNGVGAGRVKIDFQLINQTSVPIEPVAQSIHQDGQDFVVSVVLNDLNNDGQIRQALQPRR